MNTPAQNALRAAVEALPEAARTELTRLIAEAVTDACACERRRCIQELEQAAKNFRKSHPLYDGLTGAANVLRLRATHPAQQPPAQSDPQAAPSK